MILDNVGLVLPILLDQYYCYLMMLGESVESLYVFISFGQESAEIVAPDNSLLGFVSLECHYP